MIFYVVLAGLFLLYDLDLLILVVIAAIARANELLTGGKEVKNTSCGHFAVSTNGQTDTGSIKVGIEDTKTDGNTAVNEAPDISLPLPHDLYSGVKSESGGGSSAAHSVTKPSDETEDTLAEKSSLPCLAQMRAPAAIPETENICEANLRPEGSLNFMTMAPFHNQPSFSSPVKTGGTTTQHTSFVSPVKPLDTAFRSTVNVSVGAGTEPPVSCQPHSVGGAPKDLDLQSVPLSPFKVNKLFAGAQDSMDVAPRISSRISKTLSYRKVSFQPRGSRALSAAMSKALPSSAAPGQPTLSTIHNLEVLKEEPAPYEPVADFTTALSPDGTWTIPEHRFPMVMIQLPMFNEEAHAALIIERCCKIAWPRSRFLIQVDDDSTKEHVREKVNQAAWAARSQGHPVQVLRRTNRQGYKAGAMVEGLERVKPYGIKYVAIFDADFEPPKDFLLRTIGHMEADDGLGFVQTRWINHGPTLLTWAQKVNLGFHFDIEQRARSFMGWFFNFNGTAGVWRIEAIETSGGWESDTVVEDMDLSLRSYLTGWRGLYLPHVGVPNEAPDDLSTYKTQQYRWLCGPMQILMKAFLTIWNAEKVPFRLRLNCYWFFARYVLHGLVTLSALTVPPFVLWLQPFTWCWQTILFIVSANFAALVYLLISPFSFAYLLFSVATGYFKAWAMIGGLLGSKKSKSWKVTMKKGAQQGGTKQSWLERCRTVISNIGAPYALESVLALYYLAMAVAAGVGLWCAQSWTMTAYCALVTLAFTAVAFGDAILMIASSQADLTQD